MSDSPVDQFPTDGDELPDNDVMRYNLDSLDDYLSVSEQVAREGRLEEAVDVLREANKRYPDSATGRYNLGVALFLRVKQDREHLELWENLADDEQYAEEAIAALEGAIDSDPSFVEAYNNLGRLYALRGRKDEAVRVWARSLELNRDQPEVQSDLEMYRKDMAPSDDEIERQRLLDGDKPDVQL